MRTEIITSAQNSKIKLLLELQEKSKTRKKEGLFVVEGRRELLHCIEAGYIPHTVFFCPEIISEGDKAEITYKATTSAGDVVKTYQIPVQIIKTNKSYDMKEYFVGDNINVTADENNVTIATSSTDLIKFIQPLIANNFNFDFNG